MSKIAKHHTIHYKDAQTTEKWIKPASPVANLVTVWLTAGALLAGHDFLGLAEWESIC